MVRRVEPRTFLVGMTAVNWAGLDGYADHTGRGDEFLDEAEKVIAANQVSEQEVLSSLYAKLCYRSLSAEDNNNLTRTRSIPDNIRSTLGHGHGSVFEHAVLNFITTDCSRVFTHEMVRHRVGTAFAQTSGRYVRTDDLDVVLDPILEPVRAEIMGLLHITDRQYHQLEAKLLDGVTDFDTKKKITSALRRILPNGQANELGWSANLRAIRHMVQMRTSPHAEWEIRKVFSDVYRLVNEQCPLIFSDATVEEEEDGLLYVHGMKLQP